MNKCKWELPNAEGHPDCQKSGERCIESMGFDCDGYEPDLSTNVSPTVGESNHWLESEQIKDRGQ